MHPRTVQLQSQPDRHRSLGELEALTSAPIRLEEGVPPRPPSFSTTTRGRKVKAVLKTGETPLNRPDAWTALG